MFLLQGQLRTVAAWALGFVPRVSVPALNAGYQAVLYQEAIEENARLSALLALPQDEVIAIGTVVARPPQTLYDTLLVRIDPVSGVASGDEARFQGMPLGKVSSVSGATASVLLYSSPGASTEVKVGDPPAIVVLQGLGGGAFDFVVPRAVAIVPGDLVTGSAGSGVIAIVRSITVEEGRASARVYASAPVSMSDLVYVEFVRPR